MATFIFQGKQYSYADQAPNERRIEVPIVYDLVKRYQSGRVLEIGNVLRHHCSVTHDVVDKYEPGTDVIHEDVVDFHPTKQYDLIICISTLEHVGQDEAYWLPRVNDPTKPHRAIENLKTLLAENGNIVVTLPIGENPYIDEDLKLGRFNFTNQYFMKQATLGVWEEAKWTEVCDLKYGSPFPCANAIVIGVVNKTLTFEGALSEVMMGSYPNYPMRGAEYGWVLSRLSLPRTRTLEVGPVGSNFAFVLKKLDQDVHGIDQRWNSHPYYEAFTPQATVNAWEDNKKLIEQGAPPKVKFNQEDVRTNTYPDGFFDQIVAISSLEHVGLDAYGQTKIDKQTGDFNCMQQIRRILSPDGIALITIPYGETEWLTTNYQHRVYDDARLSKFLEGFKVLELEYWGAVIGQGNWQRLTREAALEIQKIDKYGMCAVVCLKVQKC